MKKITGDTGLSIFLLSIVAILFIMCLIRTDNDNYKKVDRHDNQIEFGY